MQPNTTSTPPGAATPGGATGGGLSRMADQYYDDGGRLRRSRIPVPVDQYGVITAVRYRCPKCKTADWFGRAVVAKGTPTCPVDNRRMARVEVKSPPLLPWSSLWRSERDRLWAVWVGAGVGLAGVAADQVHVSGLVLAGAALPVGEVARRAARLRLARREVKRDDELAKRVEAEGLKGPALFDALGRRRVDTVARRARMVGYCAAVGCAWTALAASVGVDPHGVGAWLTWPALAAAWAYPAATWWRYVRGQRRQPEAVAAAVEVVQVPAVNSDEVAVRRTWAQILAPEQGDVVGRTVDGAVVKAKRAGKLAGTWLVDWHPVEGEDGWAATAVGPDGMYTAEMFLAARSAIAAAFKMKAIMVTIIPDDEDENRALVSTQRTTPIAGDVRWAGPDSIRVEEGQSWRAPIARYKDMTSADYELLRWEWGTPHDFLCGTTGAGKSETLNLLLTIDRWAHYTDADGNRHGLVADLLIDPQQGQSYGPFLDDLAAPVATSLEEATLMVEALRSEMKRRNRYLSRVQWPDPKRRKRDGTPVMRKGRKWWNPLVDGPIITLNIDEAHEFLADRGFAKLVTSGARMYRKCGIRIRVATHTPLLADLGGSMALRSMLTGGFVWVGRTADSLSGPVAFNGRLQVDPRTIPEVPGMAFLLSGLAPKPMLVRSMWEPDFYDWVRDEHDEPIGFPAVLPPETWAAFGSEFAAWAANPDGGVPDVAVAEVAAEVSSGGVRCVDSVLAQLRRATAPLDMDALDAALREAGTPFTTRTIRDALAKLRKAELVSSAGGRHELSAEAREAADVELAEAVA